MNLPITVDLSVQTNKVDFTIEAQSIPVYPLYVDEPITVDLQIDNSNRVFDMALESNQRTVDLSAATAIVVQAGSDVPRYEGDYLVIPHAYNEKVLQTKNKMCTDNITVTKIKTSSTTNPYGTTFYIAEVS